MSDQKRIHYGPITPTTIMRSTPTPAPTPTPTPTPTQAQAQTQGQTQGQATTAKRTLPPAPSPRPAKKAKRKSEPEPESESESHHALSGTAAAALAIANQLRAEAERLSRVRAIIVSTDDAAVRARLRALDQPITLFGEGPPERRERLRAYLGELEMAGTDTTRLGLSPAELAALDAQDGASESAARVDDEFAGAELVYSVGSDALAAARRNIWAYSTAAARTRKAEQVAVFRSAEGMAREAARLRSAASTLGGFVNVASQRAARRTVSTAAVSPTTGAHVATVSWAGCLKVWSLPDCGQVWSVPDAHESRVSHVAWAPGAAVGSSALALGTGGADGIVKLWGGDGAAQPLAAIDNHQDRVARVAFHPMGAHVLSTSFDRSWRMFDVETQEELLLQDGHARSVYALDIHPDGSLVGTGGLDALGRLWDLRTGRTALLLQGHVHPVLSLAFSPNGYHVATGSDDNSVYIWDIRKQHAVYIIPAHTKLVSSLKFAPTAASTLVSASFDGTARVWSGVDFSLAGTLSGHADKLTSVDMTPDGATLVTASHDRTFKVWQSPLTAP